VENTQTSLSQAGANSALKATSHNTTNRLITVLTTWCYFTVILLLLF